MRAFHQVKVQGHDDIAGIANDEHDFLFAPRKGRHEVLATDKIPPARQQPMLPAVMREHNFLKFRKRVRAPREFPAREFCEISKIKHTYPSPSAFRKRHDKRIGTQHLAPSFAKIPCDKVAHCSTLFLEPEIGTSPAPAFE